MIINLRMDKVMYRVRIAIFLSFACLISLFSQTYYISSSQGNDTNSGASESSPWKTISKVNSIKFLPGDRMLFKRGDKWAEGVGIVINSSGTEGNRITIGAYGSGADPILSQERTITGTWTDRGGNVWRKTLTGFNYASQKLFLNEQSVKQAATGTEYDCYFDDARTVLACTPNITSASQVTTFSSEYRFKTYWGTENIDLYSVGEPSATYSSIKTYYNNDVITLPNVNYITIKDIEISRCANGIFLSGSSHVIIDNVTVNDAYYSAVRATKSGNTKSNHLEIKNCTFNSGVGDVEGVPYEYYFDRGNWGICLLNGADYARIHDNTITDWHHSGLMFQSYTSEGDSATTNYNEIYDNVFDFSDVNYGRAFSLIGAANNCKNNRFYRNRIEKQNLQCQIAGSYNYFYYNIIHNTTPRGKYGSGQKFVWDWLNEGGASNDNAFFNNTVYGAPKILLCWGQRNHWFNNLMLDYGVSGNAPLVMELQNTPNNTIYRNNYFYSPYIYHNENKIKYNNTWTGTIANWNNQDLNGDEIEGNVGLTFNPVTSEMTFNVSGDVLNAGINISSYVPSTFTTDINGNTITKANPNIGAVANSTLEPAGFKVYLQGAYNDRIMKTALKEGGLIPKAQPYNISPWNYNGNEFVQTVPSEIVDWVLIELRSDISSSSIVAKRAAFVRSDGSIVDLDGINKLRFDGIGSGNYYVVIQHRNHLSLMSAVQVPFYESSINYDFTSSRSRVYGNDLADLGNGRFAMYAGDGDKNGTVNILDYGTVGNTLFQTGYFQGDLDLNGTVSVLDYAKTNQNLLKVSNVP